MFKYQLRTAKLAKNVKSAKNPSRLVSQRFAGLQGVRDTLLSFALRDQAQEGLPLEIEQVLFADDGGVRQRAAGHDRRQLPPDQRVVIADAAGPVSEMNAELQRRRYRLAADRDRRPRNRRLISVADSL